MDNSKQVLSYVDSFDMVEFVGFDSIIDILPRIRSVSVKNQDGRDLKSWQDFFTSKGIPWLLLKVEEEKKNRRGETVKKVHFKLWKKCEVKEDKKKRIDIWSLSPELFIPLVL